MNHRTTQQQSRRELLRSTLRYLALGAVSLASAGLVSRGAVSSGEGGCRWSPSCGDCAAIARCRLPQALALKMRSER
jgi:hypothetical protein